MGFGDVGTKDKAKAKAALAKANEEKAKEDAEWQDNDKKLNAKSKRAEDKLCAADEKERRRQEIKELEEQEAEENKNLKGANKKGGTKVTRAEVANNLASFYLSQQTKNKKGKSQSVPQPKLEPNRNFESDVVEASNVDAAIAALEGVAEGNTGDKKMTFKQFEAENAERIKLENKGLKHSQIKELVWKEWERSPDNPKNQKES